MKVPRHILAEAIAVRTLQIEDTNVLAREIAAYLLAERRTSELESILRDILQYRQDHGVLDANVVTAHETQAEVLSDIKRLLQAAYPNAKSIRLNQIQDPSVIGGLKLDMPNQQLDMTVQARLSKFKSLTGAGVNL